MNPRQLLIKATGYNFEHYNTTYDYAGSVAQVPLADTRTSFGFTYDSDSLNPFVYALRQLLSRGTEQEAAAAVCRYLDTFRATSLADVANVEPTAYPDLASMKIPPRRVPFHTLHIGMPWAKSMHVPCATRSQRSADVTRDQLKIALGQLRRLGQTYKSIRCHGLRTGGGRSEPRHNFICASTLTDGKRRRHVILSGQHRVAALSLLGFHMIPTIPTPHFIPQVERDNASMWPIVRLQALQAASALRLFDSFFAHRRSADKQYGLDNFSSPLHA